MNALEAAQTRLRAELRADLCDGCLSESNARINEASRQIVEAMREQYGECWLGSVNLYDETRSRPVLVRWEGGERPGNFSCSFCVPKHDEELVRLILERDAAEYTGVAEDYRRVSAIHDRIDSLGGVTLIWT